MQTTSRNMRVDVQGMRHGKLNIALKDIAAIATKARTRRRADMRVSLSWLRWINHRQQLESGDPFQKHGSLCFRKRATQTPCIKLPATMTFVTKRSSRSRTENETVA